MKLIPVICLVALMFLSDARASLITHSMGVSYPVCNDEQTVIPCSISAAIRKDLALQMILENKDGYQVITTTGKNGLELVGDSVIVTLMREVKAAPGVTTTVKKYEMKFTDSLGSDEVVARYAWTVIATTESTGYTYHTTFVNELVKI
jgi:hypothetical protein